MKVRVGVGMVRVRITCVGCEGEATRLMVRARVCRVITPPSHSPPPPLRAQNRSELRHLLAVTRVPLAKTTYPRGGD